MMNGIERTSCLSRICGYGFCGRQFPCKNDLRVLSLGDGRELGAPDKWPFHAQPKQNRPWCMLRSCSIHKDTNTGTSMSPRMQPGTCGRQWTLKSRGSQPSEHPWVKNRRLRAPFEALPRSCKPQRNPPHTPIPGHENQPPGFLVRGSLAGLLRSRSGNIRLSCPTKARPVHPPCQAGP